MASYTFDTSVIIAYGVRELAKRLPVYRLRPFHEVSTRVLPATGPRIFLLFQSPIQYRCHVPRGHAYTKRPFGSGIARPNFLAVSIHS
jgi:hypothetical protein